jgi:RNA polymerase sigma-70 factor (sigma-E family)
MTESPDFEEWAHARQRAMLRTAWMLTGDWSAAEDLVQVALVKVWLRWARVASHGDPSAYFRRILVNEFLTGKRRLWRREVPEEDLPESAFAQDAFQRLDDRDVIRRLLRRLPRVQRTTLVLRFYEDLSDGQIAGLMNCPVGTVRSRISRSLEALREVQSPSPSGTRREGFRAE